MFTNQLLNMFQISHWTLKKEEFVIVDDIFKKTWVGHKICMLNEKIDDDDTNFKN
jgi:hypothetical protein